MKPVRNVHPKLTTSKEKRMLLRARRSSLCVSLEINVFILCGNICDPLDNVSGNYVPLMTISADLFQFFWYDTDEIVTR